MSVFFKPADAWSADFIPFYWRDVYHLFYLKDYRSKGGGRPGIPWAHIATTDFVNFTDYGVALPQGGLDDQDLFAFTGSVLEHQGTFHIFYTGHNPHLHAAGKPEQAIMHATSLDLITWNKDSANPILFADTNRFEPHDWRDPFVFWNGEVGEFWMLIAARLKDGPQLRRGCVAVAASSDLIHWEIRENFWTPHLYYAHECPDLFRLGEWWYFVYSTFSERRLTHYRMSPTLHGPWLSPTNDSFDGRAFYAAKTASDGKKLFAFGWNPTKTDEKDQGTWNWGGQLIIHEIAQQKDGTLTVSIPSAVKAKFSTPIAIDAKPGLGNWTIRDDMMEVRVEDSFAWCRLAAMPSITSLETTVLTSAETRGCGVVLRSDDNLDCYYQVRLEPGMSRVVFDYGSPPGADPFFMTRPPSIERPISIVPNAPIHLCILVQESIIVIYINDEIALTTRGYDFVDGNWGLFVSEGKARFADIRIRAAL